MIIRPAPERFRREIAVYPKSGRVSVRVPRVPQNDTDETTHQDLNPCLGCSMSLGPAAWSSCDTVTREAPLALFAKWLERSRYDRNFPNSFHWLLRNLMR